MSVDQPAPDQPAPEDKKKKPILVSLPTNNCARILLFLKLEGLENEVEIKTPKDYGGLNSLEYRKINPEGKFPALILEDGSFWFEAQVILDLLKNKFLDAEKREKWDGGADVQRKARVRQLIQVHDLYVASANCSQKGYFATQGCLYKGEMPLADRSAKAVELNKQLSVIEEIWCRIDIEDSTQSPGLTLADVVLYPTLLFVVPLVKASLNWPEGKVWEGRPRLQKWFSNFENAFPDAKGVCDDVRGFVETAFIGSGRAGQIRDAVVSEEGQAMSWM
eukprot:g6830.t1